MSAPKQLTLAQKEAWQASLGLLFPNLPMLRPDQVAKPLGVDLRTVSRLFEVDGRTDAKRPWLMGVEFNAGDGARMSRRISRDSAILFYALSANYEPAELLGLLLDVLENRTDAELLTIAERARTILKART